MTNPSSNPATPATQDPLYPRAVALVREHHRGSVSLVQRRLGIGYNQAQTLLDAMVGTVIAVPAPTTRLLPEFWRVAPDDTEGGEV